MTNCRNLFALLLLGLVTASAGLALCTEQSADGLVDTVRSRQDAVRNARGRPMAAHEITDLAGILNVIAGRTHRVDVLRQEYRLSGSAILAGVFEPGGGVVVEHQAFGSRVIQADTRAPTEFSSHATHVTGTIAADPPATGTNTHARGMAPAVRVRAYQLNANAAEEEVELTTDATMVTSNHSYGPAAGWTLVRPSDCAGASGGPTPKPPTNPCWEWTGDDGSAESKQFGQYNSRSRLFDRVAVARPSHAYLVATGNDRDDALPAGVAWHIEGRPRRWAQSTHNRDGFDRGGFDTILSGQASAKNVITIGAIEDIADGDIRDPAKVQVSAFSGWGPTDDGRIKPDVVANGVVLWSPTYRRNARGQPELGAYANMSGTSMATPVATGITALLHELASVRRGRPLFSDEMKAVLVHTAVSPRRGPTYATGWGAIHALDAGRIVADDVNHASLQRLTLGDSPTLLRYRSVAGRAIKATLVWLDPVGPEIADELDRADATLVNNLDLALLGPTGAVHGPWLLDPTRPADAPTRCVQDRGAATCPGNSHDNVEVAEVDAPAAGEWTLRVSGPPTARGQVFALVVSGVSPTPAGSPSDAQER